MEGTSEPVSDLILIAIARGADGVHSANAMRVARMTDGSAFTEWIPVFDVLDGHGPCALDSINVVPSPAGGAGATRRAVEARKHPLPQALPVRCFARPSIRSQELPTVEAIREKLAGTPLVTSNGRLIGAETLHAVFTAYRDTSKQAGPWRHSASLRDVNSDELDWLARTGLRKALELFGLGQRNVVFTTDLVAEAYRLSLHGLTAATISDLIGIGEPKVARVLWRLRKEPPRHVPWWDESAHREDLRFLRNYGMSPADYADAIKAR